VSLGERDSVQCGIGLPVSGAAKSVSGLVRRPDRQWCGAVVAGVGVAGLEPIDVGGLADDLGGSKRPTARQGEEGRRQLLGELSDLLRHPLMLMVSSTQRWARSRAGRACRPD
jgi:hypothetical protein